MFKSSYAQFPRLDRPESQAEGYLGCRLLAYLLIGFGVAWICQRGPEAGKGLPLQGARFGEAIAVVSTIPAFPIYFAV